MIWWVGWTCRQYTLFDAGGKCGVCNFIVDFIIYRYTLGHDAMILNVQRHWVGQGQVYSRQRGKDQGHN